MDSATDDATPSEAEGFRFTLRTLLGVVWFVACLSATAQVDRGTIFGIGLPFGLLGLLLAATNTKHLGLLIGFAIWGIAGVIYCFYWPYLNCPIELPPSAQRLKVVNKGYWYYVKLVRYEAPVADCLNMAYQMQELHPRDPRHGEEFIDKANGLQYLPQNMPPRPEWFDIQKIEYGRHFNIRWGGNIWIDTDRGIFYFLEHDGDFSNWY